MVNIQKIVSYVSISLILLIGILITFGSAGFLEPNFRYGLGAVVILYALARLVMIYSRARNRRETP